MSAIAPVRRAGPLIGVQRRLAELGRLRYGEQVKPTDPKKKPYPRSLSKWRLTSASKELLEAAQAIYGGKVREWKDAPDEGMYELMSDATELDVLLPPVYSAEDGTPTYPYMQAYELWEGPTLERRCDGETATVPKGRGLEAKPCLCNPDARACSVVTRVTVMLPRLPGLGVWRMDSRGWTVATQLPGTLDLLSQAAAQRRFVPAVLRLERRSKKVRGDDGKVQTNRFIVPVLDLGVTPGQLMEAIGGGTWNVPSLPNGQKPQLTGGPEPDEVSHQRPHPEWGEEAPIEQSEPGEQAGAREAMPARTPAPADGDAWMRAVHAIAKERGLDHDGIRTQAAALFDWADPDEHSLNELTPLERGRLRAALEELPIQQAVETPRGPATGPASDAPPAPASASTPSSWETALWETAAAHGIRGWEAIDQVARVEFPDREPDDLEEADWQQVAASIAAGNFDQPPARPRSGS